MRDPKWGEPAGAGVESEKSEKSYESRMQDRCPDCPKWGEQLKIRKQNNSMLNGALKYRSVYENWNVLCSMTLQSLRALDKRRWFVFRQCPDCPK